MYIAIDLGATNTRIGNFSGIVDPEISGEPIRHTNVGIYEQDYEFILNELKILSGKMAIDAVGLGTPGEANHTLTRIASAANMRDWQDQPLVQPIENLLNCPVYYNNDAVNEGLGEAYYGYALEAFHYLIWGSGIGGAELVKVGPKFTAEKLYWTSHFKDWEKDSGGIALARSYGKPTADFTPEEWSNVVAEYTKHLNNYLDTYKPKAVILGGGLANRNSDLLISSNLPEEVRLSSFDSNNGLYGALGLIRNNLNRSL